MLPTRVKPAPHDIATPDLAGSERAAGAVLTIDLAAIRDNYRLLQKTAAGAACAAVLKADSYGLGTAQVAPVLARAGCRHFFVAHLDEGITLRELLGDEPEIVVLHGAFRGTEPAFVAHRLIPVLNSPEQIAGWAALARNRGRRLPALLQIDTGMARFGLSPAELDELLADPHAFSGIELRYLMSHLACADEPGNPVNEMQLAAFERARRRMPMLPACLAASSGIFLGRAYHFDLVRPGAALFGVAPLAGQPNPLRPVVTLHGRVVQLREVGADTPVGYGHSFRLAKPARLATVAVGYADGFLRSSSNRGCAWLGDARLPIVGRVSMDSTILDVSAVPADALSPGALVELIGPHADLEAAALAAGTIPYEILTSLGHRYHRRYVGA
jgi:alanine racemase